MILLLLFLLTVYFVGLCFDTALRFGYFIGVIISLLGIYICFGLPLYQYCITLTHFRVPAKGISEKSGSVVLTDIFVYFIIASSS